MRNLPLERKAPIIATSIAFFLAIIKFIVGILSGSVALLSSAMDSLLDTGVSIFNYFAIKFSLDPADDDHNYGHGKIEAIAATIEGTIITISGMYIVYEAIKKIINPEPIAYINWTLFVMIISIIATGGLVYFLGYVYKKTKNLVIKADRIHYKMDLFTNFAVIITLVVLYIFPTLAWIDGIIGLLIGIYIIHEAYGLIKQGVDLLLDKTLEEHEEVKKIVDKYLVKPDMKSYHCLKTRAGGSRDKFVEFHFVMDPDTTIVDAHKFGEEIEAEIKDIDTEAFWHIVWHVDSFDDSVVDGCK